MRSDSTDTVCFLRLNITEVYSKRLALHSLLVVAALSVCAVLVHAQEQTGLVLHLCFDVHEAVVANPCCAVPLTTLLPEEQCEPRDRSGNATPRTGLGAGP